MTIYIALLWTAHSTSCVCEGKIGYLGSLASKMDSVVVVPSSFNFE